MSTVALRAAGLTKRYGSVRALDGLDLEVGVGEVHAFLGPNGAGKTTTIRILLGLLRKDGGEVSLLGGDPWRDAVELHRRLAYVPGDVTLWPNLTGGEIIDLLGRLRGGINASRLKALTERFDLDPSKRARAYSRGNRQKVALLAALAGLGYGVLSGSVSTQVPRLLGAALARLPATMVVAAVAVLLFGLLPWESIALAWTAVAMVGVIAVFGLPLQWPAWLMDISPFTQIPKLPGGTVSAASLLWLGAVALTIGAAGLIGLRHRDLGDLGPSRPVSAVRDRIIVYASFDPSRQAAGHE